MLNTAVYTRGRDIASRCLRFFFVCSAVCFFSCVHHDKKLAAEAVDNRAAMPVLDARKVTSLISDSGVVRYRITTPSWQIYDKATPAYWEFPEGVYLEKFNPADFTVNAFLEADYAYYNKDEEVWHLVGNVHALNLEGERFDTPELWWSQKDKKVYSDTCITITKTSSVIRGIGFVSNQEMTKYSISKPTGTIPIEE